MILIEKDEGDNYTVCTLLKKKKKKNSVEVLIMASLVQVMQW